MVSLRSLCTLVLGSACLSSCGTHSPSSQVSSSIEEEAVLFQMLEEEYLSQEELDDFSSEETTKAPRPQVVQIPSKP